MATARLSKPEGDGLRAARGRQTGWGWLVPLALLAVAASLLPARGGPSPAAANGTLPADAPPRDLPGLPHVMRLRDGLYSGGMPAGDVGFGSLRRLGIRTLISVDGMRPDVERARRFGLRYVHLPFGYDGCPAPTAHRLVKAVRNLPGPVFLHCHHGKNRSPVAAALVRVGLDGVPPAEAVRVLERAGTGREYVGLYAAVRNYRAPTPGELVRLPDDFPETSPVPPLMAAMVEVEQSHGALLRLQRRGWPRSEAREARHQALLLREQFLEMQRRPELQGRPERFRAWMTTSIREGRSLETALRRGNGAAATRSLTRLTVTCGACHREYRNQR